MRRKMIEYLLDDMLSLKMSFIRGCLQRCIKQINRCVQTREKYERYTTLKYIQVVFTRDEMFVEKHFTVQKNDSHYTQVLFSFNKQRNIIYC